jgi:hypothetical protein
MFARQRGATFIGILIIASIVGLAGYAALRLWPLYFEYMEVSRALEQTAQEFSGESASPQALISALNKRWTIEDIHTIKPKDIEIKRENGGLTMRAYYQAEAPFIANVSLLATFDKTVDVRVGR